MNEEKTEVTEKRENENIEEEGKAEQLTEEKVETAEPLDDKEEENALNRLIRLQADFENFRKRTQKEKLESYHFAGETMAKKLLPVLDDLERAEASLAQAGEEAKTYADGVSMVFKHLKEVLKEEGLEEINCDCSFDPNLHHGVVAEDHPEKEDHDILEVFQKGYCFKGKLIRPAMVKVCKK